MIEIKDIEGRVIHKVNEDTLAGANLYRANLYRAKMCHLGMARANLIKANLRKSSLLNVDLTEAALIKLDIYKADFYKVDLSKARLNGANMIQCSLLRTNLAGADLRGVVKLETTKTNRRTVVTEDTKLPNDIRWTGERFVKTPFTVKDNTGTIIYVTNGLDLSDANLAWADLHYARMSDMDLSWACLYKANLRQAFLRQTNLDGTDLTGATGLEVTSTSTGTIVTKDTILPDDIHWTGEDFVKI